MGETEWDATEAFRALPAPYRESLTQEMNGEALDRHDLLRDDPKAPEWVRNWSGPFDIYVRFNNLVEPRKEQQMTTQDNLIPFHINRAYIPELAAELRRRYGTAEAEPTDVLSDIVTSDAIKNAEIDGYEVEMLLRNIDDEEEAGFILSIRFVLAVAGAPNVELSIGEGTSQWLFDEEGSLDDASVLQAAEDLVSRANELLPYLERLVRPHVPA